MFHGVWMWVFCSSPTWQCLQRSSYWCCFCTPAKLTQDQLWSPALSSGPRWWRTPGELCCHRAAPSKGAGRKKMQTQHLRSGNHHCVNKSEFNSLCCTGRARAWGCCLELRRGGAPGLSGGCNTARCSLELFYSGNFKKRIIGLISHPLTSITDGC